MILEYVTIYAPHIDTSKYLVFTQYQMLQTNMGLKPDLPPLNNHSINAMVIHKPSSFVYANYGKCKTLKGLNINNPR